MKKTLRGLFISLLAVSVLTCDEDHKNEPRFLEGQEIPNTTIFDSLGCCGIAFRNPAISPDGQWVAYALFDTLPQAQGLYKMNLNTYEKTLLVNEASARLPDWSPNGEWIVFNVDAQIYKIKANGDSLTQLTFEGRNFFPDWSPNGNKIAYDNTICGSGGSPPPPNSCGILVMNADGTQKQFLSLYNRQPDWHPDGSRIICVGIFEINVSSKQTKILNETFGGADPQYSPDGSRILFWNEDGIWIINSDGTNPRRILPLTQSNHKNEQVFAASQPSWHPDGQHIIYEHYRVTRFVPCGSICTDGDLTEGYFSFYLLNVDSALAVSNL